MHFIPAYGIGHPLMALANRQAHQPAADLTRCRAPLARVLRRSRDVGTAANPAGGHVIMKICFMFFADCADSASAFNFSHQSYTKRHCAISVFNRGEMAK